MGGRDQRRKEKQATREANLSELPSPEAPPPELPPEPAKPAPALPWRFVIANAFLMGAIVTLGGIGIPRFWPSLRTQDVVVAAAAILGSGYAILKSLYWDELKTYYRKVGARRSTTSIVAAVLAIEVAVGFLVARVRQEQVVRIVPGPLLRSELGFAGQELGLTVKGIAFTVRDPQQTLFYIGRSRDHLQGALAKESKSNPHALETIVEELYKLDPKNADDKAVRDVVVEQLQKGPLLVWPRLARSPMRPTATFSSTASKPLSVTLIIEEIRVDDGVQTYVVELPKAE